VEHPQVAVLEVLKRDAFGRVERLEGPRGAAVRRVARAGVAASGLERLAAPLTRALGRSLLARERRALLALRSLADGEGAAVPRLLDWPDYAACTGPEGEAPAAREVLVRSWLAGVPLHAATALPADFFERLEEVVREAHALGVCHNDLHKEGNVLVGPDGRPRLVDFQLASVHARPGRSFRVRAGEDLRHVRKHARRYARGGDPAAVPVAAERRSWLAAAWMRFGKPVYNPLRRRITRVESEPRRPRAGPWPRRTPSVGPRSRA